MKNLRRYHRLYDICFTTNVTYDRNPILIDNIDLFWKAVENTKSRTDFEIIAWVILPDHFHMILDPKHQDISRIIQRIKMSFAAYYRKENGLLSGRVWQNRFWDHIIRDDNDMQRHVDYVHFNPVKHGLAKSPFEWEYSSVFQFYPEREWKFDLKLAEEFESGEFGE